MKKKSNLFKRIVKNRIFIAVLFFFIGGLFLGSDTTEVTKDNEELKAQIASKNSEIEELNAKVDQAKPFFDLKEEEQAKIEADAKKAEEERLAKEEEEQKSQEAAAIEAKTVTLSNGNYVAGTDFEAGKYDLIAVSGGGNVSSDNMFEGGLNAIMGTANDDMYQKEYKNISLPQGTTLTISNVEIKLVPKN